MTEPVIINLNRPHIDEQPPMTMTQIESIIDIVESRLRVHLPNLERYETEDKTLVYLRNPINDQKIVLFETFYPDVHASFGYRVWTIDAVPQLLKLLMVDPEVKQ